MAKDTVPGMAQAVERRLEAEGLSPTAFEAKSGLSSPMCLAIRAGQRKSYAFKTRSGVAHALRWPADWYDRLLAGEDASTFPDTEWADDRSIESRLEALELGVWGLRADLQRLLDRVAPPSP